MKRRRASQPKDNDVASPAQWRTIIRLSRWGLDVALYELSRSHSHAAVYGALPHLAVAFLKTTLTQVTAQLPLRMGSSTVTVRGNRQETALVITGPCLAEEGPEMR
jgi:hypothetical protein